MSCFASIFMQSLFKIGYLGLISKCVNYLNNRLVNIGAVAVVVYLEGVEEEWMRIYKLNDR